jgi:hypothetical protein
MDLFLAAMGWSSGVVGGVFLVGHCLARIPTVSGQTAVLFVCSDAGMATTMT